MDSLKPRYSVSKRRVLAILLILFAVSAYLGSYLTGPVSAAPFGTGGRDINPQMFGKTGKSIQAPFEIVKPLNLSHDESELSFGNICSGKTAGTVVVTPLNDRFHTGGVSIPGPGDGDRHRCDRDKEEEHGGNHSEDEFEQAEAKLTLVHPLEKDAPVPSAEEDLANTPGNFSRAEFKVFGSPGQAFTINVSAGNAVHDRRGRQVPGVTSLEIVDLTSFSVTTNQQSSQGLISPQGMDTIYVGGTLLVPPTAKFGKYQGVVTISVNY